MKLKLIATAAAALFVSGTAQAQSQEWYLTGAEASDTALVFVERFSVTLKGEQATATTLILRVDDAKGDEIAALSKLAFDCRNHTLEILSIQPLDSEGKMLGDELKGKGEVIKIEPDSFYDGAVAFACGGSAKPDPQLMIGTRPPVAAGTGYLRDKQRENADK